MSNSILISKTPEDLFEIFSQLKISVTTTVHEPVFTCEAANRVNSFLPGAHNKNLFLKNKKGTFFLISMLDNKRLNIKTFSQEFGGGSLSFASDDQLISLLGVEPGHVTPFALINSAKIIQVILDKEMMEYELLNFHPLRNHMTTTISRHGFLQFLEYLGFSPIITTLPKLD